MTVKDHVDNVNNASKIFFAVAAVGLFVAQGVSNSMNRLVYSRSGKSFRVFCTYAESR